MTAALKQLPLVLLAFVVIAFVTVLTYFGHMTAAAAQPTLIGVASVTGGLSLYTLASTTPNSALWAHLVVAAGLTAAVLVLALHNVFGTGDVGDFLGILAGTGALAPAANSLNPVAPSTAAATSTDEKDLEAILTGLTAPAPTAAVPVAPTAQMPSVPPA